ncbi:MAG: 5'/3'-nucleotidase SurE [Crocinitomicaceae bacterium]
MDASSKKPLILITNDDGITAKGIRSLVEAATPFGDVLVVAPDKPQSGMGHAVTINSILRLDKSSVFGEIESYTCSGTPVDCVKLAIYEVLKKRPTLLLSGINHGGNYATNVLYSGTMSAAVEGAMENIPSIGFSLLDFDANADFTASKEIVKKVIESALANPFPENICLNVNIPRLSTDKIKGIKVCSQAKAFWEDQFEKRYDTNNKPYYWLAGEFTSSIQEENTDIYALENGFASVVPIHYDMTAYHTLTSLNKWKL